MKYAVEGSDRLLFEYVFYFYVSSCQLLEILTATILPKDGKNVTIPLAVLYGMILKQRNNQASAILRAITLLLASGGTKSSIFNLIGDNLDFKVKERDPSKVDDRHMFAFLAVFTRYNILLQ